MNVPLSLQEAEQVCLEYQELVQLSFNSEKQNSSIIECVTVAPFDIINKEKFILYYLLLEDAALATRSLNYRGFLYDVVVIARTSNGELEHTDINTWLSKNRKPLIANSEVHIQPPLNVEFPIGQNTFSSPQLFVS